MVINTINSIERFTADITSSLSQEDSGRIEFRVQNSPSHDAKLLLDSMILGLEEIEDNSEYQSYIDIISVSYTHLDVYKRQVYKTLVTTGKSGEHYVFVIPIEAELDLKKCARVVEEKSIAMLPVKEILAVTGYVRGGCTAIGMKKEFPTVIHVEARNLDYIYVSGGKIGMQIRLRPDDLKKAVQAVYADVVKI